MKWPYIFWNEFNTCIIYWGTLNFLLMGENKMSITLVLHMGDATSFVFNVLSYPWHDFTARRRGGSWRCVRFPSIFELFLIHSPWHTSLQLFPLILFGIMEWGPPRNHHWPLVFLWDILMLDFLAHLQWYYCDKEFGEGQRNEEPPTQRVFLWKWVQVSFLLVMFFSSNGLWLPWNPIELRVSLFLVVKSTSTLEDEYMPLLGCWLLSLNSKRREI